REGVASVRDLHDPRHGGGAPPAVLRGVRDRPWDRVGLLAVDDQQGTASRGLCVYLLLPPPGEGRGSPLQERGTRTRDVVRVVEFLRLPLVERIRPAVLELIERERYRAAARERIDQERAHPLEHRRRQRQHTAKDPRIDRNGRSRKAPTRKHLRHQTPGR